MPEGHVALEGLETALPGDATTAANADNKDTQYAVGTSTSSMGKVHPPPHCYNFLSSTHLGSSFTAFSQLLPVFPPCSRLTPWSRLALDPCGGRWT